MSDQRQFHSVFDTDPRAMPVVRIQNESQDGYQRGRIAWAIAEWTKTMQGTMRGILGSPEQVKRLVDAPTICVDGCTGALLPFEREQTTDTQRWADTMGADWWQLIWPRAEINGFAWAPPSVDNALPAPAAPAPEQVVEGTVVIAVDEFNPQALDALPEGFSAYKFDGTHVGWGEAYERDEAIRPGVHHLGDARDLDLDPDVDWLIWPHKKGSSEKE